ncbi:MAG: hypothetical protein P1V97_21840 [Planctomycetota bacterium]|nr:hypothetical protein [Planctomycetota bacterium]
MARVLLFAADIVPLVDIPASGGGIRALQLSTILKRDGHEVFVSCPLHTYLGKKFKDILPEELLALNFSDRSQKTIYKEVKPDLVLFCSNWSSAADNWWPDCPSILDLCGPVLVEGALSSEQDPAVLRNLYLRKTRVLAKADFLICGGKRQQWYFRQSMIMAGYDLLQPSPLSYLPLGVHDDWIMPKEHPSEPSFVYAGGLYPWQNPSQAISTILRVLEERKQGQFVWIGGSHHINSADTARFATIKRQLNKSPRATLKEYMTLNSLNHELRQHSVSVELMEKNVERELALTTRTPHYLGLGLPILYGDYAELAEPIKEHGAGWSLDPSDSEALEALTHDLLDHPEHIEAASLKAQKLARNHYAWSNLGEDLLRFIANPAIRKDKAASAFAQDVDILTRGEKWALSIMRKPALKPVRAILQPFFRKKKK